jgi:integrase
MGLPVFSDLPGGNGTESDIVTKVSDEDSMGAALKLVEVARGGEPPKAVPKKRRKRKGPPPFLQEDELARLFKAIDNPRDRAIFRLAYHAGLRASEIGLLELRDYRPKTERIAVHRLKRSNSGEHHLCREEARALRAWLKERGPSPGPIFISRKGGAIQRAQLDVLMKQYGEAAGIPKHLRHFHVLKHSCCTHLRAKGYKVEDIQDWVGHVNIQNTMIYSHITNPGRDDMAAQLRDTWR